MASLKYKDESGAVVQTVAGLVSNSSNFLPLFHVPGHHESWIYRLNVFEGNVVYKSLWFKNTQQIFGGQFQAKSGMDTVKCAQIFVANLLQISTGGQMSPLILAPCILKYLPAPDLCYQKCVTEKFYRNMFGKCVTETRADVSLLPLLQ